MDRNFIITLAAHEHRFIPQLRRRDIRDVNGHMRLLHDGRADGVLEAVLWHGGEAEDSKRQVLRFTEADRRALVAFVESL